MKLRLNFICVQRKHGLIGFYTMSSFSNLFSLVEKSFECDSMYCLCVLSTLVFKKASPKYLF